MRGLDLKTLVCELGRRGIDPEGLARRGGGVWLFGSRAVGVWREDSDWDVLVVDPASSEHARARRAPLDLVFVHLRSFVTDWQGCELASHVMRYGLRLAVARELSIHARPAEAAPRKVEIVCQRAAMLGRVWSVLQSDQRVREATRLRRDIQRAWMLLHDEAVTPTTLLDEAWRSSGLTERRRILRVGEPPKILERALSTLSHYS